MGGGRVVMSLVWDVMFVVVYLWDVDGVGWVGLVMVWVNWLGWMYFGYFWGVDLEVLLFIDFVVGLFV